MTAYNYLREHFLEHGVEDFVSYVIDETKNASQRSHHDNFEISQILGILARKDYFLKSILRKYAEEHLLSGAKNRVYLSKPMTQKEEEEIIQSIKPYVINKINKS